MGFPVTTLDTSGGITILTQCPCGNICDQVVVGRGSWVTCPSCQVVYLIHPNSEPETEGPAPGWDD